MSLLDKWWKSRKSVSVTETNEDSAAEFSEKDSSAAESSAAESSAAESAAAEPVPEVQESEPAVEPVPEPEPAEAPEAPAASDTPDAETTHSTLESLEPEDVFRYFREISAIPHGSFNTKGISDYLEDFAKAYELDYVRDEKGNLIIRKAASAGCENADPIAMQGHIDMVCEKESSNPIDMDTEAITLNTDGEWLWADRTTLGGDDGIAVAIMLALLSDDTIPHPPLECIFTVDEEVGMLGAFSMDLSSIKSRLMWEGGKR